MTYVSCHPSLGRAERFDAVVFLDLPQRCEKDAIWKLYRNQFGIDASHVTPNDDQWTGAEIKACCRLSQLLGLSLVEASDLIVPVGVTASEEVERLRTGRSGRCLDASKPGIYRHETKKRRKIGPSTSSLN